MFFNSSSLLNCFFYALALEDVLNVRLFLFLFCSFLSIEWMAVYMSRRMFVHSFWWFFLVCLTEFYAFYMLDSLLLCLELFCLVGFTELWWLGKKIGLWHDINLRICVSRFRMVLSFKKSCNLENFRCFELFTAISWYYLHNVIPHKILQVHVSRFIFLCLKKLDQLSRCTGKAIHEMRALATLCQLYGSMVTRWQLLKGHRVDLRHFAWARWGVSLKSFEKITNYITNY